jgi:two-component system chemotaxis response regulator CheB
MIVSSAIDPPSVVVIGASAGGVGALMTIIRALPADFPAPVVIVLHRTPTAESLLVEILARRSLLPVMDARAGEPLLPGVVYISRPDQHLSVTVPIGDIAATLARLVRQRRATI